MSANRQIAELLDRMAKVLELTEANRFRVIAHQRGARVIKDMTDDIADLAAAGVKALTEVDGIGKGLAEKVVEFVETGKITEHDELVATVPAGVLAMMDIPGLGPKTVAVLWKQGGVDSVEQLKKRIDAGDLEGLPGIGKKKLENIGKSIAFAESAGDRVRIGQAMPVASYFIELLGKQKNVRRVDYAGSLRRGKETIGDVDILVACDDAEAVGEVFRTARPVTEVLAAGATKSSVRIEKGLQVDLRIVPEDQYGAALAYFTGSKEHNVALRQRAIDMGLRLNEYGLWRGDDDQQPVAAQTEEDIYQALDLPWVPPALREDRGEIAAATKRTLPKLVELKDVRCELHAHTTASDGKMSIAELAAVAKERGFHTVAVTDHSVSQGQANGLDAERLEAHIEAVRAADASTRGIRILAGSEVDILADGRLDYPNALLKQLDVVVASPHSALAQDPRKATARLLKAINNPYVQIIGHATGRLIGRREGLSPDMKALFKAAAENGTAFEINANPWRLDLRDTHAKAAIEAGVMLAINTDAHSAGDFDLLHYGVQTARRAWAEKKHVVNCMTEKKLGAWLLKKRKG